MQRLLRASLVAGLLVSAFGCLSEPEAPTEKVSREAFAVGGVVPWALTNGQLRMCFTQDGTLNSTDSANMSAHVVATMNANWGMFPGLAFVSGCTAPALGITLSLGDGSFGQCGLGNGATCSFGGDPNNLSGMDQTAVHEVGHGLGLLHEHQRPDSQPLCAREQTILNGCTACATGTCSASNANNCWFAVPAATTITLSAGDKSTAAGLLAGGKTACSACATGTCVVGGCSNGSCTASSYWACLGANPQSGTISVDANDKGNALGRECDRVHEGTVAACGQIAGIAMTLYDPLSIMNYCNDYAGRPSGNATPTQFDLLGVEMLYSQNRTYVLGCSVGCFLSSTGVVTSSSGAIESEWIMRGSQGVSFRVPGNSTNLFSFSVSGLPSGTSTLTYSFHDVPVPGHSRSGSGTVNKSDTYYAAMMGAIATIY